jgi:DNA-binding MltR family transcriptional regulator
MNKEPMIVRFRFPDDSSREPVNLLFHVVDRPESKRTIYLDQMKAFSERASTFMEELQTESDRGALLIAAEFLAGLLKELITARMVKLTTKMHDELFKHSTGPLKALSARIKLAYTLGWIGPNMYADLNLIRNMRNEFAAHSHLSMRFTDQVLKKQCSSFKALNYFAGDLVQPRTKFFFAVNMLALQLDWHRAVSVEPERGIDPEILMDVNPEGAVL